MIITLAKLKKLSACEEQVALFKELFGSRVTVTRERSVAVADRFDWDWAACNLLSEPAWKAYDEARASAWKAYDEARASAWKAYVEARASAWKAYDEARALAFADAALTA